MLIYSPCIYVIKPSSLRQGVVLSPALRDAVMARCQFHYISSLPLPSPLGLSQSQTTISITLHSSTKLLHCLMILQFIVCVCILQQINIVRTLMGLKELKMAFVAAMFRFNSANRQNDCVLAIKVTEFTQFIEYCQQSQFK